MSLSASSTTALTNLDSNTQNLTNSLASPPPQDTSNGRSLSGMSPPHSDSPPQDTEEPLDDDNDDSWEDIPDNSAPPGPKKVAKNQIPQLGSSQTDDDGELPEVGGVTTWAQRNPGKHVVPGRVRPKCVIGPERRHTLNDRAKNKKSRKAALYAEIAELNNERNTKLPALAKKHGFKVKLVKQRMAAVSTLGKQRMVSLYRAKLHYLSKQLNEGRYCCLKIDSCELIEHPGLVEGERLSIHELRRRLPDHPEFRNMSKEFKKQLKADLLAHHLEKAKGTRLTNKAVAQSAGYTMRRISSEVRVLF
jgi:hypothetical protein